MRQVGRDFDDTIDRDVRGFSFIDYLICLLLIRFRKQGSVANDVILSIADLLQYDRRKLVRIHWGSC